MVMDLRTARLDISSYLSKMNISASSVTITSFEDEGKTVKIEGFYDSFLGDSYDFVCKYDPITRKMISFKRLNKHTGDSFL